ncbi:heavy-metal-associated domain-containing protein [Owenweeksia hongkongensis]|uniref:heavy-metal-associated domain-containing protein n=1 Tax=Owenweeksia hongkongensis TaxID=253245 RepID=UPI003A924731
MKSLNKIFFVSLLSILATATFAQSQKDTTMIVNGVCGMCQDVIETTAQKVPGVSAASWDVKSKVFSVSYDPEQTSLQAISDSINVSGYDTEYNTATDEAYYSLHKCCYYRDPKVVEDHK